MPDIVQMTALTLTSKGQVTIRKEVLRHLGVKPGDKILVDMVPGGGGRETRGTQRRHQRSIWYFGAAKWPQLYH